LGDVRCDGADNNDERRAVVMVVAEVVKRAAEVKAVGGG
jgi:hypothetical protein